MEKKTLKVLALLISFTLLNANEITFKQLTTLASSDLNASIYLDKDIKDYVVDFNVIDHQNRGEIYSFFTTVLFDHDMYLKYNPQLKYYTVRNRTKEREILPALPVPSDIDKLHYYSYQIKNITNKDVVKTMSIFPKSQYVYLEQSDIISYSCTKEQHSQIKRMLENADNKAKESLIKITLFATKKDKIKSFGSNINAFTFDFGMKTSSFLDNLLTEQSPNQTTISNNANFGFTLFALQGHGLVEIYQEPTIRISNGKKAIVKSGLNIGYLESTVTYKENTQTTNQNIKYRDVGIEIQVMPKIKDDWVHLDLNLVSEELLSLEDNIPLTQKISYKSSVTVKRGKAVLLTGIKKTSMKFEQDGVPLLSSVPLIGELFKKQTRKQDESNINILIEVL